MSEIAPAPRPPKRLRFQWSWDALSLGSLAGIAVLLYLLWRLRGVLLVLVMSVFLAYVLEPLVTPLCRLPLPRGRTLGRKAAAGLVVLFATGLIVLGLYWFLPVLWEELNRLGGELPRYYKLVEDWMKEMARSRGLGLPPEFWTTVQDQYHGLVQRTGTAASAWALGLVASLASLLGLIVVPIGAFYILADGGSLAMGLVDGLPESWRKAATTILHVTDNSLKTYVRGQTLVVLIVGGLATVLFTLLGVRYSLALGILAGLAEAVPFIGSISVVAALVLVTWDQGLNQLTVVLVSYIVLNQLNNSVITPRLMSERLELHPFVVILAVLAGASLGGFVGAVLALPAAAVLVGLGGALWGAGVTARKTKPS
jgi:predicted PurR-regulated permease PerM